MGASIGFLGRNDPAWAAGLLRFYWFRLADVAVPLGVALGGCSLISLALADKRMPGTLLHHGPPGESPKRFPSPFSAGRRWLGLAIIVVAIHLGGLAVLRPVPSVPRADRLPNYVCWREACQWIADPQNIPPGSRFLTPRMSQTFKWYTGCNGTGHSEVVNWKDIPQDAGSIVEWWRRMNDVHGNAAECREEKDPGAFLLAKRSWHRSLAEQGKDRLRELGDKYDADYAITKVKPRLDLPVVYKNQTYVIYRLERGK
jgi:hypothetical protein